MPRALMMIRPEPHYRSDAFVEGLKACGYTVETKAFFNAAEDDLLVIWNRYGFQHQLAEKFERHNARVIVVENGYIGQDNDGNQPYAMALSGHNGSGTWQIGNEPRWQRLGIGLKPWRENGEYVLVAGQRGIGSPTMASPPNWHNKAAADLERALRRPDAGPLRGLPVRIRSHPGASGAAAKPRPLSDDLAGAAAVLVWASSVAGKALIEGIPCAYCAPYHVLQYAMPHGVEGLLNFHLTHKEPDLREQAFKDMAYAQWFINEIKSGEAFKCLLGL